MVAKAKKMNDKVPSLTDSQYWGMIRSALRSGMRFYPAKLEVLKAAKSPCINCGKQKWQFKCNVCGGQFKATEVQVDHIEPAGSLLSYADLPKFVEGLYCGEDNLQVICKSCHKVKCKEERNSGAYKNGAD